MGLINELTWNSYDSWDDPDPANYIVMQCLAQAISERLRLFDTDPSNLSNIYNQSVTATDYICYDNFYRYSIFNGLCQLYHFQTKYMKLFTDDTIIDNASLLFDRGDLPNGDSGLYKPLFCKQKTTFSNTPYNSFKEQLAEFEILDFNALFEEYKIMQNIPPRYSPSWAWKQFVKGAKSILQQCNYISSKWTKSSLIFIASMGIAVDYDSERTSSIQGAVNNINSDLSQYAEIDYNLTHSVPLGDYYSTITVNSHLGTPTKYEIRGSEIPKNFGFSFNNLIAVNLPVTAKIKFTRMRRNNDNIYQFYNNKSNSKQWSTENRTKCNFFNFGIQQIQEDTWTDIPITKGFNIFKKINQNFDQNDISTFTFPYDPTDFNSAVLDSNIYGWNAGESATTFFGFTCIAWYIDLTNFFKFT